MLAQRKGWVTVADGLRSVIDSLLLGLTIAQFWTYRRFLRTDKVHIVGIVVSRPYRPWRRQAQILP